MQLPAAGGPRPGHTLPVTGLPLSGGESHFEQTVDPGAPEVPAAIEEVLE